MGDQRGTRVYVGNLSDKIKKDDLEGEFTKYGKLNSVWIAFNPPGFAFVEFEHRDDAEKACDVLNGTELLGAQLRVEISRGRPRSNRRPYGRGNFSNGGSGHGSDRRSYGNDYGGGGRRGNIGSGGGGGSGGYGRSRNSSGARYSDRGYGGGGGGSSSMDSRSNSSYSRSNYGSSSSGGGGGGRSSGYSRESSSGGGGGSFGRRAVYGRHGGSSNRSFNNGHDGGRYRSRSPMSGHRF